MTVKIEREDKSAQELRQLARRVKDGRVSQRLLAIAMVLEGIRRKVVAENCGMDRQRLCDWVRRYNAEGVEGLCNPRPSFTRHASWRNSRALLSSRSILTVIILSHFR